MATDKTEGREIPNGMRAIRNQVEWQDLEYKLILNEGFEAVVEFRDSYKSFVPVPTDVIERVQKFLGEAGPPKWYLDWEQYRWGWVSLRFHSPLMPLQ